MRFTVPDVDISHATFKKFGDTHNYPSLNVLDYEGLQKPMHKSSTEISIYQNLAFEPGALLLLLLQLLLVPSVMLLSSMCTTIEYGVIIA